MLLPKINKLTYNLVKIEGVLCNRHKHSFQPRDFSNPVRVLNRNREREALPCSRVRLSR